MQGTPVGTAREPGVGGLDRSLALPLFPDVDELAAAPCLAAAPRLTDCTEDDLLDLVEATARAEARLAGLRAQALRVLWESAYAQVRRDSSAMGGVAAIARAKAVDRAHIGRGQELEDLRLAGQVVAGPVAHALGSSVVIAHRELARAMGLAGFPELGRVLAAGEVDPRQVDVVLDSVIGLEPEQADALVTSLVATTEVLADDPAMAAVTPVRELVSRQTPLWRLVPGRLRQACRREAARLDPHALARRHQVARAGRRAALVDLPDAMADLHLVGPADVLNAAWANLDATARQARAAGRGNGEPASNLDRLRHDIAVGWLTEGAFGLQVTRRGETPAAGEGRDAVTLPPPAVTVNVTVAATTLLGLDDEPGYVHGPTGPVPLPPAMARDLAHSRDAVRWRRLLFDPASGVATDLSRSYRPPPRMADYVKARDGWQTRNPLSCATRLELDHHQPYNHADPPAGGPTTAGNLVSYGHRDHQTKTDGSAKVSGDPSRTLHTHWTRRRASHSEPHRYADPDP